MINDTYCDINECIQAEKDESKSKQYEVKLPDEIMTQIQNYGQGILKASIMIRFINAS